MILIQLQIYIHTGNISAMLKQYTVFQTIMRIVEIALALFILECIVRLTERKGKKEIERERERETHIEDINTT